MYFLVKKEYNKYFNNNSIILALASSIRFTGKESFFPQNTKEKIFFKKLYSKSSLMQRFINVYSTDTNLIVTPKYFLISVSANIRSE